MKKKILVLTGLLTFFVASAQADKATEEEIKKVIVDNNAYTKEQLKGAEDTVSSADCCIKLTAILRRMSLIHSQSM